MVKMKNKIIILIILIIILALLITFATPNIINPGSNSSNNKDNAVSSSNGNISVTVTGDVMFGRKVPGVLSTSQSPFRYVSDVINKSDVLLVNFENPVTTYTTATKPDVPLKANPKYVDLLKINNNTKVIVAGANNHIYDYGATGLSDTLKYLNQAGITHIGAGENKQQATAPEVIEKNGHKITIFNYMDGNNFAEYASIMPAASDNSSGYSAWDSVESPKQIQAAKNNGSDCVIVYMHYGNEYSRSPNDDQKNISHLAIDAGADTVIGSHTHVTQGIEIYNGKPIFYNLGNFIFDQSNSATHRAYFVNFDITGDTVHTTIYPVNLIGYLPHHMSASDGKDLLEELNPQCSDVKIMDDGTGKLDFKLGNSTSNNTK